MYKRSYHNISFIKVLPEKPLFFGWSWLKFNNLGLTYANLSKGLNLKFRKFLGSILTFLEIIGAKLVGGLFACHPPPPPSWKGLNTIIQSWISDIQCYPSGNSNSSLHVGADIFDLLFLYDFFIFFHAYHFFFQKEMSNSLQGYFQQYRLFCLGFYFQEFLF